MRFPPSALVGLSSLLASPPSAWVLAQMVAQQALAQPELTGLLNDQGMEQCDVDLMGQGVVIKTNEEAAAMPPCDGCRDFEAGISPNCGGTKGWELTYDMGPVRGVVLVSSCFEIDQLKFTSLGDAGSTPFTAQEKKFLNDIADGIQANPVDNLYEVGSLEMLAVRTSYALANWPADQMPPSGVYTSADDPDWFQPAWLGMPQLLEAPSCPEGLFPGGDSGTSGTTGGGGKEAPPTPAPVVPAKTATGTVPSPATGTETVVTTTTTIAMPPKMAPIPVSSPYQEPACQNICHVKPDPSNPTQGLTLTEECLEPGELDAYFQQYPCDFLVTDDCACDRTWTPEAFQKCVLDSGRTDCPTSGVAGKLNADGSLAPVVPTPSPTSCTDICKVTTGPNENGDTVLKIASAECVPDSEVGAWMESHVCDYHPDPSSGCGCSGIGSMDQFRSCTRDGCPHDVVSHLGPDGTVSGTFEACTPMCHVHKNAQGAISVAYECVAPDDASHDDHPCMYEVSDTCTCSPGGLDEIRNCAIASGRDCPEDWDTRIQLDGTLETSGGPQLSPGTPTAPEEPSCPVMCRVTYEQKVDGGYSFQWIQEEDCDLTYVNKCDWIKTDECDCSNGFDMQMIQGCSRAGICPFSVTETICDVKFTESGVGAQEIMLPLFRAEQLKAENPCAYVVDNDAGCGCLDDNGEFNSAVQLAACAPETCDQRAKVGVCDLTFSDDPVLGRQIAVKDLNVWPYQAETMLDADNCDYLIDEAKGCYCVVDGKYDNNEVANCAPGCDELKRRELWEDAEAVVEAEQEGGGDKNKGWFGMW